jgi:hypothetical protein
LLFAEVAQTAFPRMLRSAISAISAISAFTRVFDALCLAA